MEEYLTTALTESGYAAKGWEAGIYGDTVICPCGHEIELDGTCPKGCSSPVMALI